MDELMLISPPRRNGGNRVKWVIGTAGISIVIVLITYTSYPKESTVVPMHLVGTTFFPLPECRLEMPVQESGLSGFNITTGLLPYILEDLVSLANYHEPLPFLLTDITLLRCLTTLECQRLSQGSVSLISWTFTETRKCLTKLARYHRNWTMASSTGQTVLYKGNLSIRFIGVQRRKHYWYIPSYADVPPSAFLPFNISKAIINGAIFYVPSNITGYLRSASMSQFLECNKTLAKDMEQRGYKQGGHTSTNPLITPEQFQELIYFRDLLYSMAMTPMLFGGTALGWMRHCDLIPDTTDLDMAIPSEQYTKNLESVLISDRRLRLYWILGKPSDSLELSVQSKGVKIDLFFLYPEQNGAWVGGMFVPKRKKLKWTYPALNQLCSCDLRGHLFLVPCNVEAFLVSDYGPQWYIPFHDKYFKWYESHHNVHDNGFWSLAEWKSVYRTIFPGQIG